MPTLPASDRGQPDCFLRRLHCDEQGALSIVSVFTFLLLAMLLGMIMNVARQVDGKVKVQNAADAATYSGGIVLARGMNTLAFTNHLLCDIFAVTAVLREAHERNAESMVPEILAAWKRIGPVLARSGFAKFDALGNAITQKAPLEQKMVDSYGNWAGATSDLVLPLLEQILSEELIPKFQRALVVATPRLAQRAANEIARRHGLTSPDRGPMAGVLWRTSIVPVGGGETMHRTLPVVDPEMDQEIDQARYFERARRQRAELAHEYLNQWNQATLTAFDQIGKMSQFAALWRGFTCGQLEKLLNQDYPDRNLPFLIREFPNDITSNAYLEQDFKFVGVVYWPQLVESLPVVFHNPSESDALAFAELALYIPRQRLVKSWAGGGGGNAGAQGVPIGGVPGESVDLPPVGGDPAAPGGAATPAGGAWTVVREGKPTDWTLLNQSWTVKLIPAASPSVPAILQTNPPVQVTDKGVQRQVRLPNLGNMTEQDLALINTH